VTKAAATPAESSGDERGDRRLGQAWTRRQALKNWALRGLVRALLRAVDRLPASLLVSLGATLGLVARYALPSARATARARVRAYSKEPLGLEVADACFANAGRNLALCALLRRPGVRAEDIVSVPGASLDVLTRALSRGRGAVVVSAHIGPFEAIPARLVELGFSPTVLVRESYDPGLDEVVDFHRSSRGIEVIHRGKPGAAIRIARALRSGRPVGILPDLGGRALATLPVSFLGQPIAFPVGPQQIARKAACPLLVGTLARTPGNAGFELLFEEIDQAGSMQQVTRRVADALSDAVARTPEEWLWMSPPHLAIAADSDRSLSSPIIRHSESGRA
jgi:KDO2-lipid IV(A) lauroyltransferase